MSLLTLAREFREIFDSIARVLHPLDWAQLAQTCRCLRACFNTGHLQLWMTAMRHIRAIIYRTHADMSLRIDHNGECVMSCRNYNTFMRPSLTISLMDIRDRVVYSGNTIPWYTHPVTLYYKSIAKPAAPSLPNEIVLMIASLSNVRMQCAFVQTSRAMRKLMMAKYGTMFAHCRRMRAVNAEIRRIRYSCGALKSVRIHRAQYVTYERDQICRHDLDTLSTVNMYIVTGETGAYALWML